MKNNNNLLMSKLTNSVMIPDHPHPLYSCFTPERNKQTIYWICNTCNCKYSYSVPSFYCTACDFDMCQKCMLQYPLYKIQIYNYNQNEKFMLNNVNINDINYRPNIRKD